MKTYAVVSNGRGSIELRCRLDFHVEKKRNKSWSLGSRSGGFESPRPLYALRVARDLGSHLRRVCDLFATFYDLFAKVFANSLRHFAIRLRVLRAVCDRFARTYDQFMKSFRSAVSGTTLKGGHILMVQRRQSNQFNRDMYRVVKGTRL